jgi:hypothetical protein
VFSAEGAMYQLAAEVLPFIATHQAAARCS